MLLRRLSRLWPDQALDGADPLLEATLGRRAEARLQPLDTLQQIPAGPPPVDSLLTASSHRDTRRARASSSASTSDRRNASASSAASRNAARSAAPARSAASRSDRLAASCSAASRAALSS